MYLGSYLSLDAKFDWFTGAGAVKPVLQIDFGLAFFRCFDQAAEQTR
jgi:hypothetical protein